ncbi:MAG: nucleotidyltransferase family protein, partial [bacterium]|nr:nucleotidyltransferase family protein [bacterium]
MKAIILAAGKGERFYPFNHFRPKPMFPICNRPLLEWTVQRLVNAGLTEIGIVVGHNKGRIKNHFADGTRFGCTISYIEQPQQLGTADAACAAATFIGQDDFFVVHGDVFFGPNALPALQAAFATNGGNGVAGTCHTDHIEHHTRVNTGEQKHITAYTWKPRGGSG